MTHRPSARHLGVALIVCTILSFARVQAVSAWDRTPPDPEPAKICRIDWRRSTWHVRRLIRCAARHHGVSVPMSLSVAFRESRFQPRAYNADSCAKGVFQHLCVYWESRARTFGFPHRSPFNARANIFVTMRMVERDGWGAWGY